MFESSDFRGIADVIHERFVLDGRFVLSLWAVAGLRLLADAAKVVR